MAYNKNFLTAFFIISITALSFHHSHAEDKGEEKKLREEIKYLREQVEIKNFMVNAAEDFDRDEVPDHITQDIKTLTGMEIRLFNSLGVLNGYVVFINANDEHTVVLNGMLKLTLQNAGFSAGNKVFFISLEKYKFKKMLLNRGDWIIGYPIKSLKYREKLKTGTDINVKAECFHLTAETKIDAR